MLSCGLPIGFYWITSFYFARFTWCCQPNSCTSGGHCVVRGRSRPKFIDGSLSLAAAISHGCGAGIKSRDKRARIVNINNMQRSAVRWSSPVNISNRPSVASQKSVHYNDTKLSNYAKLSGITTIVGKTHSGRERRRRMRIYCST